MSSPQITTTDKGSPQLTNRYSERYKSLLVDSPPRDGTTATSVLRNSPLQPNRTGEHKIFEGEKYTSFEIKNEDRGEWRQSMALNAVEDDVERVEVTKPNQQKHQLQESKRPQHASSHQPKETQQQETKKDEYRQNEQRQERPKKHVPRYMQATTSFEKKVYSSSEQRRTQINLGPRSKGGISKRVGISKIPRYQSTTNINAIEDIRSEMTSDDTYVSMAARIKLFEKGLGNGSNRPTPVHSSSIAINQPRRSPSVISRTSSTSNQSHSSVPNYTRKTVSSETKEKMTEAMSRSSSSSSSSQTTRMIKRSSNDETKPFHFSTSERASQHDKTFKEKLNLWQDKDKLANVKTNNRGIKRKNELPHEKRQK